jgi:Tfp pilus assembly protein PilV
MRTNPKEKKMTLSKIRKTLRNEKGISLLEVIVAMLFFAMITMSANTFLVGIVRANASMKHTTQATQAGNRILDNIRAKSYDDIQDGSTVINSKYTCTWTVNEASNMKKILVTVDWPFGSKTHKVNLSTIVAQ